MSQLKSKKASISRNVPLLHSIYFMLLVVLLAAQLINGFPIFAYDLKDIGNALSEGGQICPLESECDKKKENQTDAHNMTQNAPSAGNTNNEQNSIANSITNNSNRSQNETNLANGTLLNGEFKNSIQDTISITTDKSTYNPGEIVSISIANNGSEQLTFPNSALGLTIRNLATNELYPILSSQVITILGPGDSKSLRWDQMGIDGTQAPSGNYTASVNSDINTAETTFSIR
ncbi:MAG: hypothetical protein QOK84_06775 [Nitrososphaeraceae archaeon]|jgi:hypothetical protein|nr:hypothetical protein [Nitrososphaeraceae archaeon]MDW0139559.1 hypothetical protein [Nitrososphaeraceae archaeon]MDW0167321.1 hypothetical protein [Nitrososphaeraceae archaeon]